MFHVKRAHLLPDVHVVYRREAPRLREDEDVPRNGQIV